MLPLNNAVKYGLITGLILIAYTVILYALDVNIFDITFSMLNGLVTFGFMITLTVIAIKKTRDESLGEKITYVQALIVGFVVLVVSGYLNNIFSYILNTVVDPDYLTRQLDNMILAWEGKMPEESLELMIEKVEESMEPTSALIKGFWLTPLIGLAVSAIISIFIKKDKTAQNNS
jgi:predicted amino acid-binding ACT domain protein